MIQWRSTLSSCVVGCRYCPEMRMLAPDRFSQANLISNTRVQDFTKIVSCAVSPAPWADKTRQSELGAWRLISARTPLRFLEKQLADFSSEERWILWFENAHELLGQAHLHFQDRGLRPRIWLRVSRATDLDSLLRELPENWRTVLELWFPWAHGPDSPFLSHCEILERWRKGALGTQASRLLVENQSGDFFSEIDFAHGGAGFLKELTAQSYWFKLVYQERAWKWSPLRPLLDLAALFAWLIFRPSILSIAYGWWRGFLVRMGWRSVRLSHNTYSTLQWLYWRCLVPFYWKYIIGFYWQCLVPIYWHVIAGFYWRVLWQGACLIYSTLSISWWFIKLLYWAGFELAYPLRKPIYFLSYQYQRRGPQIFGAAFKIFEKES